MKNIIHILFLLISSFSIAQVSVGEWREHLNYSSNVGIIEKKDRVIAATSSALFSVNKNTNEINKLSTLNGLSEIGISALAYDSKRNIIIVGYNSGNIDLILDDEIINIPDLKNTTNINGSKNINHIHIDTDIAILSCKFGIIRFDLNKREISDTYKIGFQNSNKDILQSTIYKDTIYSATEDGIFFAPKNHILLNDYNTWNQLNLQGELPDSSHINHMASNSDMLYFNRKGPEYNTDKQFYYKNGIVDSILTTSIYNIRSIIEHNDILFLTGSNYSRYYTNPVQTDIFINDGTLDLSMTFKDKEGFYWLADHKRGLIGMGKGGDHLPSGPSSTDISEITYQNNRIYVAHGGRTGGFAAKFSQHSISYLDNNTWTNTKKSDVLDDRDIMSVAVDPIHPEKSWISSWGNGLFEREDNKTITQYNKDNSALTENNFAPNYYLTADLKFDKNGTLWVLSSQTTNTLVSRDQSGVWKGYNFGSILSNTTHVRGLSIFNDLNQKWVLTHKEGIIVLDETQNGSKYKKLTSTPGSGNLKSNLVNCAKRDQDGKVWIGTSEGLSVLSSPRRIFDGGNYDANHVLVYFDGNWEPVLDGQYINDIEIDGGNRKWFATEQGVFLTSADGTEQIHHFTVDNSPLFSNSVQDIAINKKTGEVFFATDEGIVSYKSDAQELEEIEREVLVFPNPVKPGYSGPITIDGLIPNSTVKIADVSGRIVYQTQAQGNRAVWDGNSLQGDRVSSGIYIVYSADQEGEITEVAKLSIVR